MARTLVWQSTCKILKQIPQETQLEPSGAVEEFSGSWAAPGGAEKKA